MSAAFLLLTATANDRMSIKRQLQQKRKRKEKEKTPPNDTLTFASHVTRQATTFFDGQRHHGLLPKSLSISGYTPALPFSARCHGSRTICLHPSCTNIPVLAA
jgi:hypothetical protein